MPLSRRDKIELSASIYEFMLAGESDDSIISSLGLSAVDFYEAKRFMLEDRAIQTKSKPNDIVFEEYVLEQRANIRQVDALVTSMSGPEGRKHYNALVGALRLRVDIADRIMDRSFDLGIINKASQNDPSGGAVSTTAGMSKSELLSGIAELSERTKELMESGDVDLAEIEIGPTHYGPGMIDALVEDDEALLTPIEEVSPVPVAPTERRKEIAALGLPKASSKPAAKRAPAKR